jgi:predicted aspartyl protease
MSLQIQRNQKKLWTTRPMKKLELMLLAVLALFGAAWAQERDAQPKWLADLGYKPTEVFPARIGKLGFPYLRVSINGEEMELPFDTGNMRRLVVSASAAARLALAVTGEEPSYDSSGALVGKWRVFRVDSVTALGRTWRDQSAAEANQLDLVGLFGPYYLLDRRFTLDYQRGLLAVSDSRIPANARGGSLSLVPSKRLAGMLVVEGFVNGRKVLIQIDTGKSRTCIDRALARELNLPSNAHGYAVSDIRIGAWKFSVRSAREDNFAGISKDLPSPILLGIGSDVLPQVIMTVDYPRNTVHFLPAQE